MRYFWFPLNSSFLSLRESIPSCHVYRIIDILGLRSLFVKDGYLLSYIQYKYDRIVLLQGYVARRKRSGVGAYGFLKEMPTNVCR